MSDKVPTTKEVFEIVSDLERSNEWTVLDEKLSHLENLSDSEIVTESEVKMLQLKSIPTGFQKLFLYAADIVDSKPKKLAKQDRYILSVMLAYNSEKDLEPKAPYKF
jgi:hypothetical protein